LRIRATAAAAIGMIRDNKAIPFLVTVIENDREEEVLKDTAAWALSQMDDEQAAVPLFKYIKKSGKKVFEPIIDLETNF
jgi:HEAT repeat protein